MSKALKQLAFVVALFAVAGFASAQAPDEIYLDLGGSGLRAPAPLPLPYRIPPNGSTWHELRPTYCNNHTQTDYFDTDGSGTITPCDGIKLGEKWYHITWVGPTYITTDGVVLEPRTIESSFASDPIGREWLEVAPNFGRIHKVTGWIPAGGKADARPPGPGDRLHFDTGLEAEPVIVLTNIRIVPRT